MGMVAHPEFKKFVRLVVATPQFMNVFSLLTYGKVFVTNSVSVGNLFSSSRVFQKELLNFKMT